MRIVIALVLSLVLARPADAQGGGASKSTPPTPSRATRTDTTKRVVAPPGVSLDFQDQELRVVLDALAAAGDLNVSLSNIPSQRVTLHMGRPVSRDGMGDLLRSVAEQYGLKVTASTSLIQIAGTPPPPASNTAQGGRGQPNFAQQIAQLQGQQQQMRLFTYRLKHASAVQLAPVLMNLFQGLSNNRVLGGTAIFPNPNGGFTTIQTGPGGALNAPTPSTQPNAGAGGNAGVTNIQTPFAGRGAGNAGRGGNAAAGNALQQVINGALSAQSGDIRIVAEESSNSLLIRATDADYQLVQQIIGNIDLRPLQVLIEVTIAEVERTHALDVGVSGSLNRKAGNAVDTTGAPSQASARDFILALSGGHGGVNYNVAISALQERGNVKVLSLPVIIAQNNRQAVLNVGSSRPFVQVSQTVPTDPTGRVETVQYIDVGTVLTITPTINPDGYVNLQVSQTDNSASNEVQFDAPVINKREANTQIFIRDGQTTVIGGLSGKSHSDDVSGIPLLSRIPLIGPFLFGNTTRSDDATELFLFLTPHIISSDEDIDKLKQAVKNGSELLQDVDVGPRIVPVADTLAKPVTKPQPPKP